MKFLRVHLHFKYLQECSRFSHHNNKQDQIPKLFLLSSLPSSYMLILSFLSSYTSWKYFICCFSTSLPFIHPATVENLASTLDESVLFMIIGFSPTGKSIGTYCWKFLWFCWFPPLWNWTFTRLPWHFILLLDYYLWVSLQLLPLDVVVPRVCS